PPKPRKPPGEKERTGKGKKGAGQSDEETDLTGFVFPTGPKQKPEAEDVDLLAEAHRPEPSVLERERKEVEERFLAVEGPLDAPERRELWPELARLNTALG